MIRFECDYAEGTHPKILEALTKTNFEQTPGYGEDIYCDKARDLIKKACNSPNADIHFVVGGTQANTIVIASMLRPHQGAISAVTGHIGVHETGAIEATGHKVLILSSADGKISAEQVDKYCELYWNDATYEHMVQPGMVYISQPTENGTLYTKDELVKLKRICSKYNMPLFIDGARMGYGLMSSSNDLTLEDIAANCDVFYIGGTKVGALFGEAIVITNDNLKKDFRYFIKQHGARLAKGRLLGIQFMTLFEDNLYFDIAKHAVDLALKIKDAFAGKGIKFKYNSFTNQQFPILSNQVIDKLKDKYAFSFWESVDEKHSAVRFCTSWATKEEDVEVLIRDIEKLL